MKYVCLFALICMSGIVCVTQQTARTEIHCFVIVELPLEPWTAKSWT
jgi:hypothetical protein